MVFLEPNWWVGETVSKVAKKHHSCPLQPNDTSMRITLQGGGAAEPPDAVLDCNLPSRVMLPAQL